MKNFYSQFDFQSELLFEVLTSDEKKLVYDAMEPLIIKNGSLLFYEDGVPTGIFQIKKGKAKKFKRFFSGAEQIFYIYTTGDVLGYHALFGEERYQDSCKALEDLEVSFIAKDVFFQLLQDIPALQRTFIKNIGHEFGVLANIIAVLAQKNQNARLAINLLILENRFQKHYKSGGIDLTREDLANIIEPAHFERWLQLWFETIDELYEGDHAIKAKKSARKMAAAQFSVILNNRPR